MAKIYGIAGNVVGKIANQVYAVVKGVNVVRQYNASPANPQTSAQVAQRAKLKLMSQIAAAMAPAIAFPRVGLVSSRNAFTKANIGSVTYDSTTEVATLDYTSLNLAGGIFGIPAPVGRRQGTTLEVYLQNPVGDIDVMFYSIVIVQADGTIRMLGPARVNKTGDLDAFAHTFNGVPADARGYILAYGMRFNNDDARTKYESIQFVSADVNLMVIRTALENNVTFSQTKTSAIPAGE